MPAYIAVASNTSGSTPKDLFEDVAEELQKQVVYLVALLILIKYILFNYVIITNKGKKTNKEKNNRKNQTYLEKKKVEGCLRL